MKLFFCLSLLYCALCSSAQNQNIGIGTATPNASAVLDVSSTNKGILVPRMSSQQRIQISNAATGLLVFDNTTSSFWFRNATGWVELVDSTKQPWQKNSTKVYVNNGENVGIGTSDPQAKLQVEGTARATDFFATPNSGGITIGRNVGGATRLLGGISSVANGYGYLQSVSAQDASWGSLILNGSGGNVGIGTTSPAANLHVAGSAQFDQQLTANATPLFNQGLVLDGSNANSGDGVNLLRFGGNSSGEGIGSKRTATGLQYGLDFYTGGSRRVSISNAGDIMMGVGTPSGKLTVAGDIVALNGTVKQRTYSYDLSNLTPGVAGSFTWTHNLGYQPVIIMTAQEQSGGAYGVSYGYVHLNNNQTQFRVRNTESFFDADIILHWIVVN